MPTRCFCPPDKLARHPVGKVARQLHKVQKLQHPVVTIGIRIAFVENLQRADDLPPHRHRRVQRIKRVLEHHLHADTVSVERFSIGVFWMSRS